MYSNVGYYSQSENRGYLGTLELETPARDSNFVVWNENMFYVSAGDPALVKYSAETQSEVNSPTRFYSSKLFRTWKSYIFRNLEFKEFKLYIVSLDVQLNPNRLFGIYDVKSKRHKVRNDIPTEFMKHDC